MVKLFMIKKLFSQDATATSAASQIFAILRTKNEEKVYRDNPDNGRRALMRHRLRGLADRRRERGRSDRPMHYDILTHKSACP